MVLLSFQQHTDSNGQPIEDRKKKNGWNVEVDIDAKDNTFMIGDQKEKIGRGW